MVATENFNPRSPHGERLPREICEPVPVPISIHAPRTGSDTLEVTTKPIFRRFQSTLPARGATVGNSHHINLMHISIHAPRTGSDSRFYWTYLSAP